MQKHSIGKCECSGNIVELKKVYKCEDCGKYIFKEIYGKHLTTQEVLALMQGKEVRINNLKSLKNGKKYSAYLKLEQDGDRWRAKITKFANDNDKQREKKKSENDISF